MVAEFSLYTKKAAFDAQKPLKKGSSLLCKNTDL
jgi:hypothetical protein